MNFYLNVLKIKGVEIPLDSNTSNEFNIFLADDVKLTTRAAISCTAKLASSKQKSEILY